jgi:GGDEF domain-containing protein
MAASDPNQHPDHRSTADARALTPTALAARAREEIARAERHGAGLSCLLLVFDELDQMVPEHGGELRKQMIEYVTGALLSELRCFDRVGLTADGDLALLLPGADSPRGEIVARRALERLRTIKVESAGRRLPLQVSMGLAAWREGWTAEELVAQARAALRSVNGDPAASPPATPPEEHGTAPVGGPREQRRSSAALERSSGQ